MGQPAAPAERRRLVPRAMLAITVGLCLSVPASARSTAPFAVDLEPDRAFDAACSLVRGSAIAPAWRNELDARLPDLRAAWAADGRPVIDRAAALARLEFTSRHRVVLTLCDIPSMSWFGTIVNIRHSLAAFTDTPVPLRYKVVTIDHELLHDPLAGLDLSESRMLAIHAREPARVRDHLHLFALLKAALLDLGRDDLLAEVVRIDGALPDRSYRRAWQLVNASPDGYRAYLDELRSAR